MSKAYEVRCCQYCPNYRKADGHHSYCLGDIDKRMVKQHGEIPQWCPLPDMPKKEVE